MTFESRKANPNATNSELDAKVIIQHPDITSRQREDVIEQFVEIVVDGMDTKDLVRYVSEQLTEYYEDCSNIELKEFVDNYDEDLFEELVDNSNHINQNPQKVYGGTK
mgnify:FL=1